MVESTLRDGSGSRAATLAFIADDAGVSPATVSKVLNGRSGVNDHTRIRVEASLQRHGYRRHRRRAPTDHGYIDLVFQEFGSSGAMEILRGVEDVTAAGHVDLVVSQFGGTRRAPAGWAQEVVARGSVGVVVVNGSPTEVHAAHLRRQGIPFVVVSNDSATAASEPTVGSNNFGGGQLAARHLLGLGHQRIAVISGPEGLPCTRARTAGIQSAGVAIDPALMRYGSLTHRTGYEQARHLLSGPRPPTAVIAGSDMQAMGIVGAARHLGLRVPADVSVVGYDNLPISQWMGIPLTTVDQHLRAMASTAARMVLDLATGVTVPTTRIDVATALVVRESTSAPRLGG